MTGLSVLVVIPTTRGPLRLRALNPRPGLPAPAAFADGDYRPLPWSADYARLCAPGGPLARLDGPRTPHELRLSGSFDAGRSWEAPVCLAHGLAARGHRLAAEPAQADLILWATGAVDLDLAILPGDYALLDKIERSRALLAEAPDVPLAVLLPEGPERASAEAAFRAFERAAAPRVLPLGSIREALDALTRPQPTNKSAPWRYAPRTILLAGAAVACLAAPVGFIAFRAQQAPIAVVDSNPVYGPTADKPIRGLCHVEPSPASPLIAKSQVAIDLQNALATSLAGAKPARITACDAENLQLSPPAAKTSLALRVEELRAPPGSSCRRVAFGADPPERRPVAREDGDRLAPSRLVPELCGLAFATAPGLRLAIGPELRAAALPPVRLADGAQGYFLREGGRQNLVYAVQALPEAKASPEAGAQAPGGRLVHALMR
ncbi:hypothetical protein E8E01_03640 [Methylorubrum populi]|uniref:hypothetical protein n=1 Tax=Methylorubrum TaxID=2282523 RepID=UPI00114EA5A5|nr:hypothetical protein [Methylorubrum populi]QDI79579.1 hypothetical protein E8E01_03640 [Methylorubrum populi]